MRSLSRHGRTWCLLLASALLAWGIGDRAIAEDKPAGSRFPNVTLRTQNGEEVEFYNDLIKDKNVIINMMYTQCTGICDQSAEKLEQVQEALGDRLGQDVFIYSITLDPEHDTPEVLKKYAEAHGAKPGWTFLTGNPEDITALRGKLGLSPLSPKARAKLRLPKLASDANDGQRQHSGMVVIGSDLSDRWHMLPIQSSPTHILEMVERLKPPSPSRRQGLSPR